MNIEEELQKCDVILHGGDIATMTDLPVGTAYTVTEAQTEGFTTTVSGTGTVTAFTYTLP